MRGRSITIGVGIAPHSLSVAGPSAALASSLFVNDAAFFAPTVAVTYSIVPALVAGAQTFPAATVAAGSVDLAPAICTNANSFFAATITASYSLAPALLTNASTFPAATVGRGAVSLTPSLLTNAATFFAATVAPGAVALAPSLFANGATFFAPTVALAGGAQSLTPSLLANSASFYAPSVGRGEVALAAPLLANVSSFAVATALASNSLAATPFVNQPVFHAPTVTNAATNQNDLAPPMIASGNVIYGCEIGAWRFRPLSSQHQAYSDCPEQVEPLAGRVQSYPLRRAA